MTYNSLQSQTSQKPFVVMRHICNVSENSEKDGECGGGPHSICEDSAEESRVQR